GFHRGHTRLERHRACDEERERTTLQPRPPNHAASRLRRQPEPPMADRKRIWMAQADRPDAPGEAARTAQRRLAVRLQLRSPQPDAAAQADRPKSRARPQAAVRLKFGRRAETAFQEPPKSA